MSTVCGVPRARSVTVSDVEERRAARRGAAGSRGAGGARRVPEEQAVLSARPWRVCVMYGVNYCRPPRLLADSVSLRAGRAARSLSAQYCGVRVRYTGSQGVARRLMADCRPPQPDTCPPANPLDPLGRTDTIPAPTRARTPVIGAERLARPSFGQPGVL